MFKPKIGAYAIVAFLGLLKLSGLVWASRFWRVSWPAAIFAGAVFLTGSWFYFRVVRERLILRFGWFRAISQRFKI